MIREAAMELNHAGALQANLQIDAMTFLLAFNNSVMSQMITVLQNAAHDLKIMDTGEIHTVNAQCFE